jgi:hypothetical protein
MGDVQPRRHQTGAVFQVDDWHLQVISGDKGWRSIDGIDQVLQLWVDGEWRTLELGLAFAVLDVVGQNEDRLYPHGRGGGMTLSALKTAYRDGWQVAWAQLQRERRDRDERERARQLAMRHQPPTEWGAS